MTTEGIKTIPDLESFTGQEYVTDGFQIRRAYINTIFLAHNLQLPPTRFPAVDRLEEGLLVGTFLKESSYGPSTRLAQLVQVIVCEATLVIKIRKGLRGGYRDRERALENSQTILPEVRRIKQEISQGIFGDESTNYTQRLSEVFFAHRFSRTFPTPEATEYRRRQERAKMLNELITEISTRFPLTSR